MKKNEEEHEDQEEEKDKRCWFGIDSKAYGHVFFLAGQKHQILVCLTKCAVTSNLC